MSDLAVVSAKRRILDDDDDEADYSSPPVKIRRAAFGYVTYGKTAPTAGCKSCYYFDSKESECELFEAIQGELPELFNLDKSVAPNAGCRAHIAR